MYPEDLAASSPEASNVNTALEPTPAVTAAEPLLEEGSSEVSGIPPEPTEISDVMSGMPDVPGIPIGQLSRGQVVKVTDAEVMVDIGLKSEGAIPRAEFLTDDGLLTVQPGDEVDVIIEDYDEQEGTFTVSHRKAAVIRAWEELERASRENTNVKGRVLERTKGGLTVSVGGVRAFLPASQADLRPLRNPDSLVGQEIECKVIKLNQARSNVVVSRKATLEEEAARRKAELAGTLVEGAETTGVVKNLTTYGAFVDLGGMDGLLHVTDLAWGRVGHPSEVVKVGQELRVKILKFDPEKGRISLGLKQLLPDPWERVLATYKPGNHLKGRVVSLTDYGAFCEIEPGVEGLIHVSEMTWSRHHKHPSKFVKVDDQVEVSVLEVNSAQRRISLSLRQTLGDPWTTLAERLAPGAVVEGRVRNLTDYGAFVEVEDGVEGLIHVSDLSWTKNVKHPSEVLKKGQKVRAAVVSIDPKQRRISLGLKQLQPDAWETFFDETPVGTILPGKVVRLAQFGGFVELREGIEGLCHVSEMGEDHGRSGKDPLKIGAELPFRVIRVSREERRVGLSLKQVDERPDEPPAKPRASAADSKAGAAAAEAPVAPASTTMGEKMAQAIRAAARVSAARRTTTPVGPASGEVAPASLSGQQAEAAQAHVKPAPVSAESGAAQTAAPDEDAEPGIERESPVAQYSATTEASLGSGTNSYAGTHAGPEPAVQESPQNGAAEPEEGRESGLTTSIFHGQQSSLTAGGEDLPAETGVHENPPAEAQS